MRAAGPESTHPTRNPEELAAAVARILAHAAASQSGSDGATWTRDELHDRNDLAPTLARLPEGRELPAIDDLPSEPEESH